MRDFLKFLQNSHFFFLFIFLEIISIFLAVRNSDKKNVFISSANYITGVLYEKTSYISSYFSLIEDNTKLKKENEYLKNHISNTVNSNNNISKNIENLGFYYQSATVIKNSIYKPNNIITLNKGVNDRVEEGMAVVSDDGVIGIVANVSSNYCTAISLLNSKISISGKVKRTNFFGSLKWEGNDYRYITLFDIPDHTSLYKGDEIVTTGYSTIFPEGISIGTVSNFYKEGSFYKINVKLSQDFNNLRNVYIVEYINKDEIIQLEDSTKVHYQFIDK